VNQFCLDTIAKFCCILYMQGVEDIMPSELSGGMKKRVALARSIIFDNTKETIEPEVYLF
jgi:ABC-type transporter Mla maintaining outer membrane lipid asymmetry ATPase subunit MlaF